MKKQWRLLVAALTLVLALTSLYVEPAKSLASNHQSVFSGRTLVRGSYGYDVEELQGRLKFLGYYHGKVDSHFGWSTYWALRNFQYRFGMNVDGKAAPSVQTKLWSATRDYRGTSVSPSDQPSGGSANSNGNSAATAAPVAPAAPTASGSKSMIHGHFISANDKRLLANIVYGEARGEPFIGQVAIVAVILNRLDSPLFPHTIPSIIFQPGAFTSVQDGQAFLTPNAESMKAVNDAMSGWDPSSGAIYYFNPATATSKWIWGRPQIKKIGKHIFCR